jgi:hypothetical protein
MQRIEIRRPLIKALKKLGVNISDVPENMIARYVRRIKGVLDDNISIWLKNKMYRTHNLDILAKTLVMNNINQYAAMLKRTLYEDVLAA